MTAEQQNSDACRGAELELAGSHRKHRTAMNGAERKLVQVYLTLATVRPAEPAHDGRPHPGEGPGQGPEKRPIGDGEVGEARREEAAMPGKLDWDVHGEGAVTRLWPALLAALRQLIYRPPAPVPARPYCSRPPHSANTSLWNNGVNYLATLFLLCVSLSLFYALSPGPGPE